LRQEAAAVFLVSHALSTVRQTCSRALWIDQGQLVMDGEANAVVDAYWEDARNKKKVRR
jgi:teichoic acid transport system ATP-binding protein